MRAIPVGHPRGLRLVFCNVVGGNLPALLLPPWDTALVLKIILGVGAWRCNGLCFLAGYEGQSFAITVEIDDHGLLFKLSPHANAIIVEASIFHFR